MSRPRLSPSSFREQTPIVLDGAFGTELIARGKGPSIERANLTDPALVLEVARAYVAAGARFIRTNSFQANALALGPHGLGRDAARLNQRAAELSAEAAGEEARVVGSIGPVGLRFRKPEPARQQVEDAYAEQARALAAGGAEALVLETFVDLEEAELALQVLRRETTIPFGVCLTFPASARSFRTVTGATPTKLLAVAENSGAAFVGANCGTGLDGFEDLASELLASRLPVWLSPSAGLPSAAPFGPDARAAFATLGAVVAARGVALFGGCCGTDPAFIRALCERLRAAPPPH